MKKIKMAWEWNWPYIWSFSALCVADFHISIRLSGDHSPGITVHLVIMNIKLLDFGYYNIYHDQQEDWN